MYQTNAPKMCDFQGNHKFAFQRANRAINIHSRGSTEQDQQSNKYAF